MARCRRVAASLSLSAGILLALFGSTSAFATDYSPPALPFFWTTVGSGGALIQDQGTGFSASDTASVWNTWTAKSKLSAGTAGCGTTTACIDFAWEGATLYWTYCTLPYVPAYAETDLIGVTLTDSDCTDLDDGYRIFVAVVDYESYSFPLTLHIPRHETGHAIGLWEAPDNVSCWNDVWIVYPLMKHDYQNCANYKSNFTATFNEAVAVVLRSGW